MTDILQSIGFTSNHCLVSDDIIDLLNTLYNDKTTYLSLLPTEIFNIITQNLYINLEFNNLNKETLKNLFDKYCNKYILIVNKDITIILNIDSFCMNDGNPSYHCDVIYIIIPTYMKHHGISLINGMKITIEIDTLLLYSYEYGKYRLDLCIEYTGLKIYFIEPDDKINKYVQLFHNLIMNEFNYE